MSEKELADTYIALTLNGITNEKAAESALLFNPDDSRADSWAAPALIRED
ncbi:hypothetical protein [Bacillus marinisedimentorum]|nr:hypothetical protein [Bacillus marinisedimentorum]